MKLLKYVRCIALGGHRYVYSRRRTGYRTCIRCRHRRRERG